MQYGRTLAAVGKDEDAAQQFNAAIRIDPKLTGVAVRPGNGIAATGPPAGSHSVVPEGT